MRTYTPREWPYKAREARDEAATEAAAALSSTVKLSQMLDDPEALKLATFIVFHLQNNLRHLESVGAPTRPPTEL
jgi:hypothetical protein